MKPYLLNDQQGSAGKVIQVVLTVSVWIFVVYQFYIVTGPN